MEPNITRFQCVVKLLARLKMLNEYTRGGQAIPASSPTARRFRMSRTGRTREIASFASYGRGDQGACTGAFRETRPPGWSWESGCADTKEVRVLPQLL